MGEQQTDNPDPCLCEDVIDGFRYDVATAGYVHKRCGKGRPDGPTPQSVIEFIDRLLAKRAQRQRRAEPERQATVSELRDPPACRCRCFDCRSGVHGGCQCGCL